QHEPDFGQAERRPAPLWIIGLIRPAALIRKRAPRFDPDQSPRRRPWSAAIQQHGEPPLVAPAREGNAMTALRGYVPAADKPGRLGVHSLDSFVLTVPELAPAERFYADFGLRVAPNGNALTLKADGDDHAWGTLIEGKRKRLHHLSFGCYADDLAYLQ